MTRESSGVTLVCFHSVFTLCGAFIFGLFGRALALAKERNQEYATLEHLLLSLSDDQDAIAVLKACGVDLEQLNQDLAEFISNEFSYN